MKEILDKIINRPIRTAILIGSISAGIVSITAGIANVIQAAKQVAE